jgi:hypothetical protein
MMPARASYKVAGIDGVEMRALPGQAFIWTSLRTIQLSFPIGSAYLGAVSCPPLSALDTIKKMIVPSLRGDISEIRLIGEECIPIDGTLGYDAQFDPGATSSAYGGKIRIEYESDGRQMEEEIFCTVTSFEFQAEESQVAYVVWMVDNIHSFRAIKGTLDGFSGAFQVMMHSFRINPLWFDRYNSIVHFLKGHQTSRYLSMKQVNDETEASESNYRYPGMQSYRQRQEIYRWIAGNVGCKKSRTDEYYDSVQEITVQLPCGYGCAWASDAGEYVLSSYDNFKPETPGSWKPMEKMVIEPPGIQPPVYPMAGHG